MPRSVNNVAAKKRKKKWLKAAKGYFGGKSKLYKTARQAVEKGWSYAYRDRKAKKRSFRQLWIIRINAAARLNGLKYSTLIDGLNKAGIVMDRRTLAFLAMNEPEDFAKLCDVVKNSQDA